MRLSPQREGICVDGLTLDTRSIPLTMPKCWGSLALNRNRWRSDRPLPQRLPYPFYAPADIGGDLEVPNSNHGPAGGCQVCVGGPVSGFVSQHFGLPIHAGPLPDEGRVSMPVGSIDEYGHAPSDKGQVRAPWEVTAVKPIASNICASQRRPESHFRGGVLATNGSHYFRPARLIDRGHHSYLKHPIRCRRAP